MSINVYIPAPFRRLTGNRSSVHSSAADVNSLLDDLDRQFPGFRSLLCNERGEVPTHINIYVNNREIHTLDGTSTQLEDGDEVAVIPAIAGGASVEGNGATPAYRPMTPEQVQRYSRHIIMSQVGSVGQRKLLDSKVLIIGAGGLGSPAALYLAAAGVGTIGLVDFDTVDLSNLQRQLLHHTSDVGRPKVDSARDTIASYNPDVTVIPHPVPLTSDNAFEIFEPYDLILNGVDNFPARYLANDAAYLLEKTLVDGGIFLFEGLASVFKPGKGCYRCLFPTPPPPGMVPSCAEAGVLGVLPGIIGSIMAIEAIKLILDIGEP
ncbi:MAG TPA: ThiF family adenylyltransferase, partial [Dehalococcoidia bacterium]|nr:ThiF family adenylyltransferase [Dehalococcoidia bacterium]